MINTRVINNK